MSFTSGGIVYYPYGDNEAVVGKNQNTDNNAVVGSISADLSFLKEVAINGVKRRVTIVGNYSFRTNKAITSIFIHRYIRELKTYAFDWCTNVKRVSFENNSELWFLGPSAFNGCIFTDIVLPQHVSVIQINAFSNNPNIVSLFYTGRAFIPSVGLFYNGATPKYIYVLHDYKGRTFDGQNVIRLGRMITDHHKAISFNSCAFFITMIIN